MNKTTYDRAMEKGMEIGLSQGLSQGLEQGLQISLLRFGRKRFGNVPPEVESRLLEIHDVPKLEVLSDRIAEVRSWDELLGSI